MKKIFSIAILIAILTGCNSAITQIEPTELNEKKYDEIPYLDIRDLTPIYNEVDKLIGYLLLGQTDQCGSDCSVDLLFLNNKNGIMNIENIEEFSSASLGFDLFEKNKYTYISKAIYNEGEGHFGCHYFEIKKTKIINKKLETLDVKFTNKKYAFDAGDAQGSCNLFQGIEGLFEKENLFE